jgi:hypothetical protein
MPGARRHSLKSQAVPRPAATASNTSANSELSPSPFTSHPSFSPRPPLLRYSPHPNLYFLLCLDSYRPLCPVVLVLFLSCEGASDSFYHSDPSSLTHPCDIHRDLPPNSVCFISHIPLTSCPKFKADRLRAAEYPPVVAVVASALEVAVVEAPDLRMPTTQTLPHLKRVRLDK